MGYPMTYIRVVGRNNLSGDYAPTAGFSGVVDPRPLIRGDLRRLETDSRDPEHIKRYAQRCGISKKKVKQLLDLFFDGGPFTVF